MHAPLAAAWAMAAALAAAGPDRPAPAPATPSQPATRAADRPSPDELLSENRALKRELSRLRTDAAARRLPAFWLALGFFGQFLFGLRFVVQWIVTERRKRSTIPLAFWYLSLAGTIVLLTYAIYLRDPVFIAGFSLNMIIYLRNLYFIHRKPPQGAGDGKPD